MKTAISAREAAQAVSRTGIRRRGFLFYIKRIIKWMGIGVVVLILSGMAYQAMSVEMDKRNFLPSGQFYAVDGRQIHLKCTGIGSPTVILEAGAYSYSTEWYWVQGQLEKTNRVCSYDRAGNGWSESADGPRDGLTLARELHTLLAVADVPGPYVIVGHSLGGVLGPIYAAEYRNEVLGLVLVDSAVPKRWDNIEQYEAYKGQFPSPYSVMTILTRLSVIRFILNAEFQTFGYPPAITSELIAMKSTNQAVDTWDAEVRLAMWDLGHQLQAVSDLGALPVVVMWASRPDFVTTEDRALLETIWGMFPTLSSNQVTRIVDGANHGSIIGNEHYAQQVSDAVFDVFQGAGTGEALTQ